MPALGLRDGTRFSPPPVKVARVGAPLSKNGSSPGMRESEGQIVAAASPEAAAAAIHGVIVEPPTAQLPAIGKLDFPVLLLVSSERGDTEEGRGAVERFREAVPQAEVERIADSGHDLLADQPEETIFAVGEFLSTTST